MRDGLRCIIDSKRLADYLVQVIKPHLPETVDVGHRHHALRKRGSDYLQGLNERCRFLVYRPGQHFAPHVDGTFQRQDGDYSRVTIQLYLHDVPESHGGATTFIGSRGEQIPVQPRCGSCLIFSQDLLHEGSTLHQGLKYTMRTEAMYTEDPERAIGASNSAGVPELEDASGRPQLADIAAADLAGSGGCDLC